MKRAASIFIVLLILLSSMSMLTVLAVNETETPLQEEPLDLSNGRSSTAAITIDFRMYRNSDMSRNDEYCQNMIDIVNTAFESNFDVTFNTTRNQEVAVLNQREGCTYSDSSNCSVINCGEESDGTDCYDNHHKAADYFIEMKGHSTEYVFRYVDYAICRYNTRESRHKSVFGLTDPATDDIIVSLSSDNISRTTAHELSHWLGTDDNVCASGEACCVNGSNAIVWCSVCTEAVENYLDANW